MRLIKEEIIRSKWEISPFQWAILVFLGGTTLTSFLGLLRLFNYTSQDKTHFLENPATGQVVDMKNVPSLTRAPKTVEQFVREFAISCNSWDGTKPDGSIDTGDSRYGVTIPTALSICLMAVEAPYRLSKVKEIAKKYKDPKIGFPLDKFLSGRLTSSVENYVDVVNLSEYKPGYWSCDLTYTQRISGAGQVDQSIVYSGKMLLKAIPPNSNVWTRKGSPFEEGAQRMQNKGLIIQQFD